MNTKLQLQKTCLALLGCFAGGQALASTNPQSEVHKARSLAQAPEHENAQLRSRLKRVERVFQSWSVPLDLASFAPDTGQLLQLQHAVHSSGLTALQCLREAARLQASGLNCSGLLLGSAWALEPSARTDQVLLDWILSRSGRPDTVQKPNKQKKLAALWALILGRRQTALQQAASSILKDHWPDDEESSQVVIPDLLGFQVWLSLRHLHSVDLDSDPTWKQRFQRLPQLASGPIVAELWALSIRQTPEPLGLHVVEAVKSGNVSACKAIEELRSPQHVPHLSELLHSGEHSLSDWQKRAALRGLVAGASTDGLELVHQQLARAGVGRELALAALDHCDSLALAAAPTVTLSDSLLSFLKRLESDEVAYSMLANAYQRALRRTLTFRSSSVDLAKLRDRLETVRGSVEPDSKTHKWLQTLALDPQLNQLDL